MVAHVNAAAIRVKNVIVIAVIHIMTFNFRHLARRDFKFVNASIAVVRKESSIGAPVWRFNNAIKLLEDFRFTRFNVKDLQNRLVAIAVPSFTRRNFKCVAYAKLLADFIHERHKLHRFCMCHFWAFPNNWLRERDVCRPAIRDITAFARFANFVPELSRIFNRLLACENFVFVAVAKARRFNSFNYIPGIIKQFKLYHVIQVLYTDLPRRSINHALVMRRRNHRSLEIRLLTVFVRDVYPVTCIHACFELNTLAIHGRNFVTDKFSVSINTLAKEQICKCKAVNADIQKRTTRQRWIMHTLPIAEFHRKIGFNCFHISNATFTNPTANRIQRRQKPRPHRLAQENALVMRKRNHLSCKFCVRGKSFLHQDVPAMINAKFRKFMMMRMRRCDINQVNSRI